MRFGLSDFVFRVLVFRRSGVPAFRRSGVPAFRRSGVFPFGVESVEQRGTGIENDCLCVKEFEILVCIAHGGLFLFTSNRAICLNTAWMPALSKVGQCFLSSVFV